MFKVLCSSLLAIVTCTANGQSLPTQDEVFGALYGNHYDPATKLATWDCPREQQSAPDVCMYQDDSMSGVTVNLLQEVILNSGTVPRTYVVTSVKGHSEDCHACAPLMGFGIFRLQGGRWQLESKNVLIRFGSSGQPGQVELVRMGPDLHGFMLTNNDGHQGYFATTALLLAPKGVEIQEVWNGFLDEDYQGTYDPTGKEFPPKPFHVDATYKFLPDAKLDHYKLQVISHGFSYAGGGYHSRTSVTNYRYVNGKYEQVGGTSTARKEELRP